MLLYLDQVTTKSTNKRMTLKFRASKFNPKRPQQVSESDDEEDSVSDSDSKEPTLLSPTSPFSSVLSGQNKTQKSMSRPIPLNTSGFTKALHQNKLYASRKIASYEQAPVDPVKPRISTFMKKYSSNNLMVGLPTQK